MAYDARSLVNITIEVYSLALVLVLILATSRQAYLRKRLLLLACMWAHLLSVGGELVAWLLNGHPGALARAGLAIGVYLNFAAKIVVGVALAVYVCTDASSEPVSTLRGNRPVLFLLCLSALNLLLCLTNPLTHIYYRIDEANTIVWSAWFHLFELFLIAQFFAVFTVIARLREKHSQAMMVRLLICGLLVMAAMLMGVLFDKRTLVSPAVSLVLVMLTVGVQFRLEENLAEARIETAETRMRLLSGQIHPHFIFNSLSAIKALVVEDPALAEQTIQDFSDYLRSHLDEMSSLRLVSFSEEMDHVRHYVSLEMADMARPLEVTYDLAVDDFFVPPLTVQPLVENAIRHGIRTREEGGTVLVRTRESESVITISVIDDGHGFSSATERQTHRSRIGLANVRERIERQCNGRLDVHPSVYGTTAVITLPKEDQ